MTRLWWSWSHRLNLLLRKFKFSVSVSHWKTQFCLKRSNNSQILQFRDEPKCRYWKFATNSSQGQWSSEGCTYNRLQSNRSYTVCECDHLTNFAALLDISNREGPNSVKSILSYVSSGLNCLFILATIYIAVRHNKKTHLVNEDPDKRIANHCLITLNISSFLLMSHLMIMFGMDRTDYSVRVFELN